LSNPASVRIEWDTATEVETAGFNIFRSQSPEGDFVSVNGELIPSLGDPQSGASYTYVDQDVLPGETYYYVLEEIEYDSTKNRYLDRMFSFDVPNRWWVIVTSVVSILIGLALLVNSFR
jgi:hypothetical protein